jgi:phosphopantothenoylcysteine decarboxylase / phosphopantothenate---cysteine ligase
MAGVANKRVVLGITGGIAAYKGAELCRLLVKGGATVQVVMTAAARQFITPLTLQALSGRPVAEDLFDADAEARMGHIRIGDEADLIVIAPATADTIARLAAGRADDLLAAVVLASRVPVLLAPAMNVNMWSNPLTQQNLGKLLALGRFRTVGPDQGDLACGWVGEGRLIEPPEILGAAARLVSPQDLAGRKVVITAGPTQEPIDDVRFLGNRSSGKMGFALAAAAARRGAEVTLLAGPVALATPPGGHIVRQDVETAEQMREALQAAAGRADVVVMAAAVGDFRPARRVAGKLSRRSKGHAGGAPEASSLALVANPDLLAELGKSRTGRRPLLIGFAAETGGDTEMMRARAREKLVEKRCDVIVLNDVGAPGLGFGSDENAVTLLYADGRDESLARSAKEHLADDLWDRIAMVLGAAGRPFARSGGRRHTSVVRPVVALGAHSRGVRGRSRRG